MKYFSLREIYNGKILLYLFTVSIYLPMIFTNIISILLVLFVIINYKNFNFRALVNNRGVIAMTAYYFLIFTGFLYDINSEGIFNDLEKKLSFLVLPIAICVIKVNKDEIRRILEIFFFSGFFFTSIAFLISTYNVLDTGNYNSIINHNLSNNIGLHATYLSMYLLFSLSYPLIYMKRVKRSTDRFLVVLISACLLTYILLLSVRIIWLLFFVLLTFEGVKLFKKNKRHLSFSIVGVLLFSAVIIYNVNPLKERFNELVNYNSEYNTSAVWKPNTKEVWGGRGIRLLIWQSCLDLIKQAPFKGYGSSIEVQKQLDNIYIKNKIGPLLFLINNRGKVFNPHNQYLEEVLKFGTIVGLSFIVFLWVFINSFYKTKNKAGMLFLIIITGVSLTETVLELNKGIVFFSFFFSLLYSYLGPQKNQKFNELKLKK
ncbi:O-antigen ligase family protein [Flavobacteriaceae bacterium]|nr:O-antigen ligase family protein [Flavobacteriaceae bacterium]